MYGWIPRATYRRAAFHFRDDISGRRLRPHVVDMMQSRRKFFTASEKNNEEEAIRYK